MNLTSVSPVLQRQEFFSVLEIGIQVLFHLRKEENLLKPELISPYSFWGKWKTGPHLNPVPPPSSQMGRPHGAQDPSPCRGV